eukprot:scaffold2607_cov254-Pinguiococcus_pyrenoidosus.AAC.3
MRRTGVAVILLALAHLRAAQRVAGDDVLERGSRTPAHRRAEVLPADTPAAQLPADGSLAVDAKCRIEAVFVDLREAPQALPVLQSVLEYVHEPCITIIAWESNQAWAEQIAR